MPRAKVGGYVKDDDTKVKAHTRGHRAARPTWWTPSPGRSGRNFRRMFRSVKAGRRITAFGFGTLAVGEIAAFAGLKAAGGILMGTGLFVGVVGGALWFSARR